jgi:hypothetical protein
MPDPTPTLQLHSIHYGSNLQRILICPSPPQPFNYVALQHVCTLQRTLTCPTPKITTLVGAASQPPTKNNQWSLLWSWQFYTEIQANHGGAMIAQSTTIPLRVPCFKMDQYEKTYHFLLILGLVHLCISQWISHWSSPGKSKPCASCALYLDGPMTCGPLA